MKILLLALVSTGFLTACGLPDNQTAVPEENPRIKPMNPEPGISLSGSARVGMTKTF